MKNHDDWTSVYITINFRNSCGLSVLADLRQDVLDSSVTTQLVEILKNSTPSLQRKAASVLEYAIVDSHMDTAVLKNIEDGLDALFQQKMLTGNNRCFPSFLCFIGI